MANTILTPTAVTREALRVLHQKLNFVGSINRQYDDSFAKSGAKIGDSLKIRLPNQYTVRTGAVIQTQDTAETSVTLQVATQKGVDVNFSSAELTMSLDDFSSRIIEPAMAVLAANIEYDAMTMYKDVYQAVWNSGSALTLAHVLDGRKILQDSLTPLDNRSANLDGQQMVNLVTDSKQLFNDQREISKQYREGYVGRALGFDFSENSMWPGHTRGAAASYVCNTSTGITSGSSSITLSGGSGSSAVGDVFVIDGVFKVHPETKANTGIQQQFVVTTAGTTTQVVSPTPVTSGAGQNITIVSAGANKTVAFAGTASGSDNTGLLYHKDAFTFATADLLMPKGVDMAAREVMDGISMRLVRQYDINNDAMPCRLDVLYGYKTLRAQLAARLHNN
jgi:hypothetical protein